jgi:threonine/homoserine/homoserine lactone efflux protein
MGDRVMTYGDWYYAVFVEKAGEFLRKTNVRRTLEGITGLTMLALGLRIATSEN